MEHPEKNYTTNQIFNYFNVNNNSSIIESGQILATVVIMKKSKHLLNILNDFYKAISEDKLLITDYYNTINQEKHFKDNRHDQSILSVLRKIHGSIILTDETYIVPFGGKESLKYPFWATRIRG
jgi:hypothetical protein